MRGTAAKQRAWDDCEAVAKVLKLSKFQVHKYLYKELKHLGWIYCIINKTIVNPKWVKELPGYKRMLEAQEALQMAERDRQLQELQKRNEVHGFRAEEVTTPVTDPEGQIRLAMWFIKKMGSIETARKAMEAASAAVQALAVTKEQA